MAWSDAARAAALEARRRKAKGTVVVSHPRGFGVKVSRGEYAKALKLARKHPTVKNALRKKEAARTRAMALLTYKIR